MTKQKLYYLLNAGGLDFEGRPRATKDALDAWNKTVHWGFEIIRLCKYAEEQHGIELIVSFCLNTLMTLRHLNWIKSDYLSLHSTFHSLLFEIQEFLLRWFIGGFLPPSTAILNYFPCVMIRWVVKWARALSKDKMADDHITLVSVLLKIS